MRTAILCPLLVAALAVTASEAGAQSRSDTGRHRPQPVAPEPAVADTLPAPPRSPSWFLGATGGFAAGSDLFTVDSRWAVPWVSEAPFSSDHFDASLEGAAEFGLYLGRRVNDLISLRGDLAWADLGVSAEARTGQVGDVYRYDTFSVLTAALGAEFRLVRNASHPYLGTALTMVRLAPRREKGLEQTNLGGRLSLGYQQVLDGNWSLRLEGRVVHTGFSVGDWVPTANQQSQPEVEVEGQPNLTTWSLVLGVQLDL